MNVRSICFVLMLACLPGAGCGTVANIAWSQPGVGRLPFGGVSHDMAYIKKSANGDFGAAAHPKSDAQAYPHTALMLLCAADLPFSLVGDIVTWPYTASYTYVNQPTPVTPVIIAPPLPGPPAAAAAPPPHEPMPLPLQIEPKKLP